MKILCVHPGASMSTHDVWLGLTDGLKTLGHEVLDYALDGRIEAAGGYLNYVYRKAKRKERPEQAAILYKAGEELVARALRAEPDVVLIVSAMFLHPDIVVLLKRAGLKVAILFTESPYDDERQARLVPFCDVAWTNERTSARLLGVEYLPHAWHPSIHQRAEVDDSTPAHDVVFVGTGFQERCDLLRAVDWTGIDLGLYGSWDLLGSRNPLRASIRGGYIDNAETAKLYQRAKIGLNLYRQSKGFGKGAPRIEYAASLNPRAYELAALGCFTISDDRPEVAEVFGDLVPTFETPQHLEALMRTWLADDAGRARVAAALPGAVALDTWTARAATVINHLVSAGIGARDELQASQGDADAQRVSA